MSIKILKSVILTLIFIFLLSACGGNSQVFLFYNFQVKSISTQDQSFPLTYQKNEDIDNSTKVSKISPTPTPTPPTNSGGSSSDEKSSETSLPDPEPISTPIPEPTINPEGTSLKIIQIISDPNPAYTGNNIQLKSFVQLGQSFVDESIVTYKWENVSGSGIFSNSTVNNPIWNPPGAGSYKIKLTVSSLSNPELSDFQEYTIVIISGGRGSYDSIPKDTVLGEIDFS